MSRAGGTNGCLVGGPPKRITADELREEKTTQTLDSTDSLMDVLNLCCWLRSALAEPRVDEALGLIQAIQIQVPPRCSSFDLPGRTPPLGGCFWPCRTR